MSWSCCKNGICVQEDPKRKKRDWEANTSDGVEKEIGNKTKVKFNTK